VSVTRSPSTGRDSRTAGTCRLARDGEELEGHFAVRHAVFVEEQQLFVEHDRDDRDDDPRTLHAIGSAAGVIGGAVRLYSVDDEGLWKGDRLAVLPEHRHGLLGAALVHFAVRTAGGRGGDRMVAMIQVPNVRFFQGLGWSPCGQRVRYHGADHQPMDIPLAPGRRVSRPAR
jgi:putative N-acetyltransferase (TIGR04045 family)